MVATMRLFLCAIAMNILTSGNAIPLSPGGPYNTSAGPIEGKINVHLVPHTHDDVGWLKTVEELYLGAKNHIQISAVQFILDSVIDSLLADENRKFIYVEIAFFSRWWRRQSESRRAQVLQLIDAGRLEFINGGWVSNDEATPTFVDIMDQHTMGTTFIAREIGPQHNPTIGWQVDPFGHSLFQAKAYAKMGMNGWFFGRSDSQDFAIRQATRRLESLHSDILAGSMDGYGPPSGFDWNIISADEPLNDDEYLGEPNIERRVNAFVEECLKRADYYNQPDEGSKHIMLTMGSDFQYEYAHTWFSNLDKLIHYANLDGRVNVFYSTPSIYTEQRSKQSHKLENRSDYDWFPYCDSDETKADGHGKLIKVGGHAYWTGYFTSRPLLKRLVREASTALELCRIMEIASFKPDEKIEDIDNPSWMLWEALSVVQHHDGVSGTARQNVTDDYERRLRSAMDECGASIGRYLGLASSAKSDEPKDFNYQSMMNRKQTTMDEIPMNGDIGVNYYFAYYNSSMGKTTERAGQASGAYIFRPDCPEGDVAPCRPTRIPHNASWVKHRVVDNRIEWEVGPIPEDNGVVGKEVVLIIEPKDPIHNRGTFFTDSNGYEWVERKVNERKTWKNVVTDPVAGNYYPVTAGISILDSDKALVVIPDRSVGGTSLVDNQIEIMVHRRTFADDLRGVDEPLDERTSDSHGIVVSGQTRIVFARTNKNKAKVPLRVPLDYIRPPINLPHSYQAIQEVTSMYTPQISDSSVICTQLHRVNVPEFCQLGEHDCILVRLSHRDISEGRPVPIDFNTLFQMATVYKVTETVLHAGKTVEAAAETKIHWTATDDEGVNEPEDNKVIIAPGQIRTFILEMVFQTGRPALRNRPRGGQLTVEVI